MSGPGGPDVVPSIGAIQLVMAVVLANSISFIAASALVISAYCDIRFRLLPDTVSIILVVLALVRWSYPFEWQSFLWAFACGLGVFLVTAAAFARGWLGGGDVKLMSATSFLLGSNAFLTFIVIMGMVGGVLSLGVLAWHFLMRAFGLKRPRPVETGPSAALSAGEPPALTVPYGAAIALAGLYVLYVQFRLGVN